ncbi:MAG: I78 family peptidase inhibitor [Pseudomonadota bacterium]|nr:I78 family peptidase inhibitor [Pseudomonadota bacterium]
MNKSAALIAATAFFTLAACGASNEASAPTNEADDFAARINGAGATASAPQGTQAPKIAEPLSGAAPGAYAAGTATDPQSATCGANKMGPFLGQRASDEVRQSIMTVAADTQEIRFIAPGSDYVKPDPTHPRLNIMVDTAGVIRDARCG